MVYEIDGKHYVMANHKFYEVTVKKQGTKGYDVHLVDGGKILEFKPDTVYTQVTLDRAYKPMSKKIED